jgi:hypothetical protein
VQRQKNWDLISFPLREMKPMRFICIGLKVYRRGMHRGLVGRNMVYKIVGGIFFFLLGLEYFIPLTLPSVLKGVAWIVIGIALLAGL